MIGLGDEGRLVGVAATKGGVVGFGDAQGAGVAEGCGGGVIGVFCGGGGGGCGGIVFAGDEEDLEAFPAKGAELGDEIVHVFGVVEGADDGVELELDAVGAAPGGDLEELAHGVAAAAADVDVGLLVEGVAADGEDIDVSPE